MIEARNESGTRGTSSDTEDAKQGNKGIMVMGELGDSGHQRRKSRKDQTHQGGKIKDNMRRAIEHAEQLREERIRPRNNNPNVGGTPSGLALRMLHSQKRLSPTLLKPMTS